MFGGVPERALACAFVAGLPDDIRRTVRAGCRAEDLDLADVLTRARAVLSDESVAAGAAAGAVVAQARGQPTTDREQFHEQ